MAQQASRRVRPDALRADRAALTALKSLDGYAPRNEQCTTAALQTLEAQVQRDERALLELEQALAQARSRLIASSWAFHNGMLAAKAEVIAQFGNDSFAVQAVGLTPRSERKRPRRAQAADRSPSARPEDVQGLSGE